MDVTRSPSQVLKKIENSHSELKELERKFIISRAHVDYFKDEYMRFYLKTIELSDIISELELEVEKLTDENEKLTIQNEGLEKEIDYLNEKYSYMNNKAMQDVNSLLRKTLRDLIIRCESDPISWQAVIDETDSMKKEAASEPEMHTDLNLGPMFK